MEQCKHLKSFVHLVVENAFLCIYSGNKPLFTKMKTKQKEIDILLSRYTCINNY